MVLLVHVHGLAAAERVSTQTLFVHSDGGVFPDNVKQWKDGRR